MKITANMRIEDVLQKHPQTRHVFQRHGLACADCHVSKYESIGQGAQVHDLAIPTLLDELNTAAARPLRGPLGTSLLPS